MSAKRVVHLSDKIFIFGFYEEIKLNYQIDTNENEVCNWLNSC